MERLETGFRLGKNKVKVLRVLGEIQHNSRTYRVVRVRVSGGEEYVSLRLYNSKGKFIKQFMMEPEITQPVGYLLNWANTDINDALMEAETKAWEALSGYKFMMFGYWAAIWVHLNKLSGLKLPNPFKKLVGITKKEAGSEKLARRYPSPIQGLKLLLTSLPATKENIEGGIQMSQEKNQSPPGAKQLHDYAEVRGLVVIKDYHEALAKLKDTELNISTKEHLQKALESNDQYIIDRTFTELDARIMQALCWECWGD